ncbi:MAG TPA: inorganic phosphate transporter [Spirochaetota bacterium]|nr:inorganic phosphate transporter [Spirochaetota bacterium]HPI87875.1 inorganic phosphate transporter [Spirochaetota bacterium]HPR47393.1 inorganic phosphate transporter [Spirochaetota bacterium]
MTAFLFLSSGLFLGWSLGANDAANIFGTAVGSKMVKFKTAAIVSGMFIILGAVISGAGAARTLGKLGSVNEIAGSFIVALAAGLTVYWMTKLNLPVSTTQAIVGAIIGWNFFSGSTTDYASLSTIVSTWILCPVLCALFSIIIYIIIKFFLKIMKIHLLKQDLFTRIGLIIVGAFGAFSLGANNIANVMGVFVSVSPFRPLEIGLMTLSDATLLFLIGGFAIALGVVTYSQRVMETVGSKILKLTPEAALVVVLSTALVMFLFASERLEFFLASHGLPTVPLVPVSSSQGVIGAVVGIGLVHGGRDLNGKVLAKIASGWITAPVIAGIVSFIALFFFQNVFNQHVFTPIYYEISHEVVIKMESEGYDRSVLENLEGTTISGTRDFKDFLTEKYPTIDEHMRNRIISLSEIIEINVDVLKISKELVSGWFTGNQAESILLLNNRKYRHLWRFYDDLISGDASWKLLPATPVNRLHNNRIRAKLDYLKRAFNEKKTNGKS